MSLDGRCRLPAPYGLLLDRDRPLEFRFAGQSYTGLAGDTVASALAAHGRLLLSRSFKYHRPRGLWTLAGLDAHSYVQAGDEPNAPADRLALREGLEVSPVNIRGSLERDRDAWLERLARFLPVGFYYKTFYRPSWAWKYWERLIRARAGLGRVDPATVHEYHDKQYLFADVAVIGAGPAGLAAALEAARSGAEVILMDDQPRPGGWLNHGRTPEGPQRAAELAAGLAELNVTLLTEATVTGWFADNWLAAVRGRRLYKLRAGQVIAATGCVEQPLVFRNNDLPGIMAGSAVQGLIRLYGVRPGRWAVVATGNDHGYAVALDLLEAGVELAAVVELRPAVPDSEPARALGRQGVAILAGHTVTEALADSSGLRLGAVRVTAILGEGRTAGRGRRLDCDLLVSSVGYAPLAQLLCHGGARLVYAAPRCGLEVDRAPAGGWLAGSLAGVWDLDACLAGGRRAGWAAARAAGFANGEEPPAVADTSGPVNHPWPIFPHPKGKDFVDFDEDQTVADIHNAIADGFEDLELVKRYTTIAMGPSQGRHSALNALRIAGRALGRDLHGQALTTQRPPFRPESFAHLAGRGFEPQRLTPMHHRHRELRAKLMPAGLWWRPAWYGQEREAAVRDEVAAVRGNVGLIDVSTLGKLEVRGPEAAEFLNRIYTFAYKKQPAGRLRYGLATDLTGAIIDDGVAARLDEQRFYVTATTGGVDGLYRSMLRWNAEWRLEVDIANVTAAYAAVNLAGPRSRELLSTLEGDLDLSPQAFPYLGVRDGQLAGIPARLLRVGFVGELGYEIHVPASMGEALWDKLMKAGAGFGLRPFGVEAQRLLRLEKGHIIVGQDSDGLSTPAEVDMLWAVAGAKPFFVGSRALRVQGQRPLGRKLVGFTLPLDGPLPEECLLVIRDGAIVGRVTSVARSVACGAIIGLAYVHPDDAGPGGTFAIKLGDGRLIQATVTRPPFYDPDNRRQEL